MNIFEQKKNFYPEKIYSDGDIFQKSGIARNISILRNKNSMLDEIVHRNFKTCIYLEQDNPNIYF